MCWSGSSLARRRLTIWLTAAMGLERGAGIKDRRVMARLPRSRSVRRKMGALIIGPCSIPPEESIADLLGARGDIVVAHGTMLAAIETLAELAEHIAYFLTDWDEHGDDVAKPEGIDILLDQLSLAGCA